MDSCPMTREGIKCALMNINCIDNAIIEANKLYQIPVLVSKYHPRAIIMELYGQDESALDALRVITLCRGGWPDTPIIVCTAIEDPRLLALLKNMGVRGICLKIEPIDAIINCVKQVVKQQRWYSNRVESNFDRNKSICTPLTSKEIDVLEFIFSGKSVTRTSLLMHRDVRTVSTHKRNAMSKLGFKNDWDMFTHGGWMLKGDSFH
ncbi:Transcriptional regulatory protein RcsB [compost metagenome]